MAPVLSVLEATVPPGEDVVNFSQQAPPAGVAASVNGPIIVGSPAAGVAATTRPSSRRPPAIPARSVRGVAAADSADQPQPKALKTISFEGCITCRLRKKKCDQGRPTCETCQRLSIECLGYHKKRPAFLRDSTIAAVVRADLTMFLSRTGKVPNRGRGAYAPEGETDAERQETFKFAPYMALGAGPSTETSPTVDRDRDGLGAGRSSAGMPPSQPGSKVRQAALLGDEPSNGLSSPGTPGDVADSSSGSSIRAPVLQPSGLSVVSSGTRSAPETINHSPPGAPIPPQKSWAEPRPSHLPMGADARYGPFWSPPWQQAAVAAAASVEVPRPMDSPLSRLDLPREQYELVQIYVTFIDVYASIAISEQELRQHNKLHHQMDNSDAQCDCMDEALIGKTVTHRAFQNSSFVEAACALASKYREKKLLCATEQGAMAAGAQYTAAWRPPRRNEEAEVYKNRAYATLISSLHTPNVNLITALFTCQRLIWSCVYDGGINAWTQPLVVMRYCLQSLVQSLSSRSTNVVNVRDMDPRMLFLLRRVVTIDIAATISQESSTPLLPFYQALLTSPDFHLSTGSDMLSHVSSSNIICSIFLESSVLKAWKRASGPAIDPLELAARAAPVQALIDMLLGGSFEESLQMFGYDYFSSPFRMTNFLCSQICAQAGQIYLSATLHDHDPTHPAIATAVTGIIDLVSVLPTKLCLPAIVFPLFFGALYASPVNRPWFVDIMSPATLGLESLYLGNVGPMRLLRDEVWRRQDDWEARGRFLGADRVDWLLVMRHMRAEILLM